MRFLMTILITALLAWLTSWLWAWWMIAVIPFVVAVLIKQKVGRAFMSGLLGIALLWLYLVLKMDIANHSILSTRMAGLFGLGHTAFLIVNILLGGLIGGLGGWSGAAMRGILKTDK